LKTERHIRVGDMLLVLRSDGGVYLGRPDPRSSVAFISDPFRIGSSAAVCRVLSEALLEMEEHIRSIPNEPKAEGREDAR
jgi:hypothetical protein